MELDINSYKNFFNKFENMDMNNEFEVKKLAINFRKWANWNKKKVTIDVYQSFALDVIVVIHDLFGEAKIVDSWEFLDSVVYILEMYIQTEKNWEYMTNFWYAIAKI